MESTHAFDAQITQGRRHLALLANIDTDRPARRVEDAQRSDVRLIGDFFDFFRDWDRDNLRLLNEHFGEASGMARAYQSVELPQKGLLISSFSDQKPALQISLAQRVGFLSGLASSLAGVPSGARPAFASAPGVFIGHGRSALWRDLDELLASTLGLQVQEFNREPAAGLTVVERMDDMLDQCGIAFLVLTAEDNHGDGSKHARENVIHELGLFTGRRGARRAIVLLEESCQAFSNLDGVQQLHFPAGRIEACFEDVRRVLRREGWLAHVAA